MEKFALFSVFYKEGIEALASALVKKGYKLIATGGTYAYLADKGFEVKQVEDITGVKESPLGRVKTLHPAIFAGILARRDSEEDLSYLERYGFPLIDFVVVNLYPFDEKLALDLNELVEFIDVGGVSLIRASVKNFPWVTLVCDPSDYGKVAEAMEKSGITDELRRQLALKGLEKIIEYDTLIHLELSKRFGLETNFEAFVFRRFYEIRYGENPHQKAYACVSPYSRDSFLKNIELLHGIELSYNNILDAYSAYALVSEFEEPAACIVKHNVPCGVGIGKDYNEAYEKALKGDELSAFGGIVAFNGRVEEDLARALNEFFFEIIIARDFSDDALAILRERKKRRIIKVKHFSFPKWEYRFLDGDLMVQERDARPLSVEDLKVVSGELRKEWIPDIIFGDKVIKYVRSNAIILVKDGMTVGIGGGQPSRVDATMIALNKAGERANGAILISDGFFPFSDSIELAAQRGVKVVVEPGGSVRDQEVIEKAKELGINLIFTGLRRFRH